MIGGGVMALFSSNLKKMQNELGNTTVDWGKLASFSSGRYDLSGKNSSSGKTLVGSLIKKASDCSGPNADLTMVIRNLHSRGGDFNRSLNETGNTAIHIAASLENGVLLKALLDAGIPPVATTHSGATALHKAVAADCADNVSLLLASGADPGAEDNMSNSPLHLAAQFNKTVRIATLLLKAGAKAYHRNSSGKRPVDLAEERNFTECVDLLADSLKKLRRNRQTEWSCPSCGTPMKRPVPEKADWYLSIEMWDHLRFVCGSCGAVSSPLQLDGEV